MSDRRSLALLLAALLLLGCATPRTMREAAPPPPAEKEGLVDLFAPLSPEAARNKPPRSGPLNLSLTGAALMALEGNGAFAVRKFTPSLLKTTEEGLHGEFDTLLEGSASVGRQKGATAAEQNSLNTNASATRTTAGGTTITASATAAGVSNPDLASVGGSLTLSQALLKGGDREVNLALIKEARLDTAASEYELFGLALTLTADAQSAYLRLFLAKRRLELVERSMEVARTQQAFIEEQIRLGKLAELELASAQSEVAFRAQAVIDAKSAFETAKVKLLGLIGTTGPGDWSAQLTLADPETEAGFLADPLEEHLAVGLKLRPELNQARLEIKKGELELIRTAGATLPRLDAFVTLGGTGYAEKLSGAARDVASDGYAVTAGLKGSLPWERTSERAAHRKASVSRAQALAALKNVEALAEVDMRTAYLEVSRQREQIPATAATRKFREATLGFETEKFRVGRSTNLAVVLAQRDLLEAQLAQLQAQTDYQGALIELFRQDGSLLARLGIKSPGSTGESAP